jgi:predicted TIM-barrel fold metal-dependent hydrolase
MRPYCGDRLIHDADSHLMESPDWLMGYAGAAIRSRLRPLGLHGQEHDAGLARSGTAPDPERAAEVMATKNWGALGASDPAERSRVLDILGFRSQLVFSTYSHLTLLTVRGQPQEDPDVLYGGVTAHNRGVVDFCRDPRLLPVAWVSPDVPERAVEACREALDLGCAAVELPTYPVGPYSLTHPAFHELYRMLEEADCPLVFHVGGGGPVVDPLFAQNGIAGPGHDLSLAMTFLSLPAPTETLLAAFVFHGILERFPGLRCGVVEQGATWLPAFLRRLDLAWTGAGAGARHQLSRPPSEYVVDRVKVTPFPFEDTGWLVGECGPDVLMFGTDYPHDEGSADPLASFDRALTSRSADERDAFYRRNFEVLMGRGLTDRVPAASQAPVGATDGARQESPGGVTPDVARSRTGETLEVLRKKALFRLLARDVAARSGVAADDAETAAARWEFAHRYGMDGERSVRTWMRREGIAEGTLRSFLADTVLLDKLAAQLEDRLDAETLAQYRISTARSWPGTGS